jgi:hypothetical protein
MPRKKTPQKRLGKHEQKLFNKALATVRGHKIFWRYKAKGETWHNNTLINTLLQAGIDAKHANIPTVTFLGETFRCEAFVDGGAFPLLAVECKKALTRNLKAVWKEGLSQALLYSATYKRVILVFYDFTNNGVMATAFSRGNKLETAFCKQLREKNRITTVVLKPS